MAATKKIPQPITTIARLLQKHWGVLHTPLHYSTHWEFLVAVMLSAQCTDVRVNIVTEKLFQKYRTLDDYADAEQEELAKDIGSITYYNSKARHIIAAAKLLRGKYNGEMPQSMRELLEFPGVARKTGNVILSELFQVHEGVVVDTHVLRTSKRLGLTKYTDPVRVERDLMALIPRKDWGQFSIRLVFHGRYVCVARKPKCGECVLNRVCVSAGRCG